MRAIGHTRLLGEALQGGAVRTVTGNHGMQLGQPGQRRQQNVEAFHLMQAAHGQGDGGARGNRKPRGGGTGLVSHEIGQQMHAVLSPPLPADPGHHTRGVA